MSGLSAARAPLDEQLSQRDRAVIRSLSELRFLSARQLERWHYVGASPLARARAARRGLERLTKLGVLTRLDRRIGGVRSGSAGYIYALDLAGQRIAARHGWLNLRRTRRLREPGRTFLLHVLAISELHAQLVAADRAQDLELVERQAEPSCWRAFAGLGGSRQVLRPDSFVVVATPTLMLSWFCEVDRDTEGSATIERKLTTYIAYWRSGQEIANRGVQPRTLWLAPTTKRRAQLEAAIGRLPV